MNNDGGAAADDDGITLIKKKVVSGQPVSNRQTKVHVHSYLWNQIIAVGTIVYAEGRL